MRKRTDIEQHLTPHIKQLGDTATKFEIEQLNLATNALVLEVLLDIRELLQIQTDKAEKDPQ